MDKKVAIIGAGPGGLVAARYLIGQGFEPRLFEAHDKIGGQWEYTNPSSGVWPLMRTNTARMVTRFSDLDYPEGTKTFPRNQQVGDYLRALATKVGLDERIELNTRVTGLEREGDCYTLTIVKDGESRTETFGRVVVASGASTSRPFRRFRASIMSQVSSVRSTPSTTRIPNSIAASGFWSPAATSRRWRSRRISQCSARSLSRPPCGANAT